MDILSTSGISQLIYNHRVVEQNRLIYPLQSRKEKYSKLDTAWSDLSSKLNSLKSILYDFKSTTSSSIFGSKKSSLSSEDFFSITANSNATLSSYSLRVNQLAKNDLLLSETKTSDDLVAGMEGTHSFQVQSGDLHGIVNVELGADETNKSMMEKISNAMNSDKAIINSASFNSAGIFTGSGEFKIDINGEETSIAYDYSSGMSYDEVMNDLVTKINESVPGVTAEKSVDGSNVGLNLKVDNKSDYISVEQSGDTGNLLSSLNIDVSKEKSVAGLSSASVFAPVTGSSKLSFTAVNSGYENRLVFSDLSGSALSSIGLTSDILTNRTMSGTDDAAGYRFSAASSTDNELDSKIEFNGINVRRSSNTITDLLDGITINLKSVMDADDPDVKMDVDVDTESVKTDIQDFVKKFNEAYTFIKKKYYSSEDGRGVFVGDSTALSLMNILRNQTTEEVDGIGGAGVSYLSQIGITFDPATGLSVDDSDLENAIKNDPEQIEKLFNSENGVAAKLHASLESYLGADGSISKMTESIGNNIQYLTDKITQTNERIDKGAEVLRKKYEGLQMQLAALMNAQSYFGGFDQGYF